MARNDPPHPPRAEESDDPLRRLEERLDRASEAAERLIGEVAGSARSRAESSAKSSASRKPPPAGWQVPREEDGSEPPGNTESELFMQVVQSLRDLIPPDLQQRLADALREVLLAVRALIDWYLERLEQRRSEPVKVQDIPIL